MSRTRSLALSATVTAAAALLLAGCSTPSAPADGGDNPDAPVPAVDLPA